VSKVKWEPRRAFEVCPRFVNGWGRSRKYGISQIGKEFKNPFKGLYFHRRGFHVDGERGGYNLHFAWSSALRAKEAILCSIK